MEWGAWDRGVGTWHLELGHGTWDLGPGARDHSWETRLWIYDLGPGPRAWDLGGNLNTSHLSF